MSGGFSDLQQATVRAIGAAPFAPETWPEALALVAAAGGGWAGQLIGVSPRAGAAFNRVHGLSATELAAFERAGGTSIAVNPRIGAILRSPVMRPTGEPDFIDEATRCRHPFYQDFLRRYDDGFCCFARLHEHRGVSVVAAVLRSERQGPADAEAKAAFAALLPHLDAAVRLQTTLEGQGAAIAAGVLDALAIPAILCDAQGRIVGATAGAEAALREETHLRTVLGRLRAADPGSDGRLQAALARAVAPGAEPGAEPGGGPIPAVVLHGAEDGPLVADVAPLPIPAFGLRLGAVAAVVLQARRQRAGAAALLGQAFGLTAAEAAVALAITRGERPADVAAARGVSVETVRHQVKSIFAKSGTGSQAALVRRVTTIVGG